MQLLSVQTEILHLFLENLKNLVAMAIQTYFTIAGIQKLGIFLIRVLSKMRARLQVLKCIPDKTFCPFILYLIIHITSTG